MKTLRLVLWVLVVVVAAATAGVYVGRTFLMPEENAPGGLTAAFTHAKYPDAGGDFSLLDPDGNTVTAEDLRGKPYATFFGFTHCPDVCPTTLFDASGWLDALGPDADKIRIVFVSVDPERDTPEVLGQYVSAFDERILGLTAHDNAEIRDIADRYKIRYEKVPLQNGDYTMNHTADILLFDKDGDYAGFIPYMPPNVRQNETIAQKETTRVVDQLKKLIES